MKEWAAAFYGSKSWADTRRAYLISQHYICERCGEPAKLVHHKTYIRQDNIGDADITLSFDNLEALCQDCHNKEHHANESQRRYEFDEDGRMIERIPP